MSELVRQYAIQYAEEVRKTSYEEGFQRGYKIGERMATCMIACLLKEKGLSVELIADLLDISIAEVIAFTNYM